MCHYFLRPDSTIDHSGFWEHTVAPTLAKEWRLNVAQTAELTLAVYGFPRGRIVPSGKGWRIFHGNDYRPYTSRAEIISAYSLKNPIRFQFDDHEQCQSSDQWVVKSLLGLTENWPAVD